MSKVSELISILQKLPQDAEVLSDDNTNGFYVVDINDIKLVNDARVGEGPYGSGPYIDIPVAVIIG
jgi:hypothetical protein